ncbi:MAG TPA: carbohydrate kinase family protein [Myxococcota bacterium]|nr:carbohydrate kinase family protein [Myxococcota bacterium]
MSILVTGSIAIDHIMVFRDRFRNHILPDRIHTLNVSFHVPTLRKSFGGTGANIAFALRQIGEDPLLLGAVGRDFDEYAAWLDRHGIRRDGIRVLDDAFTAQCFITTDLDDNQITAFHSGAMDRAHEARLDAVREPVEVAIVAPNGKRAMQEYARELKRRGVPSVIDPGQGLPLFAREELVELLEGAAVYVVNDYEWSLTLEKTGLDEEEVVKRVGALVVTLGEHGSRIRSGARGFEIPAVPARAVVDPTGCGDAYRAGLLHGLARGLSLETCGRLGSLLGSLSVEREGTQCLELAPGELGERFQRAFGAPPR